MVEIDTRESRLVIFIILCILSVLSIVCSLYLFYNFFRYSELRQRVNNQVILLLVIICFIQVGRKDVAFWKSIVINWIYRSLENFRWLWFFFERILPQSSPMNSVNFGSFLIMYSLPKVYGQSLSFVFNVMNWFFIEHSLNSIFFSAIIFQ